MIIKARYIAENSLKNIWRTKGIGLTLVLSVLVSVMGFFTLDIYLFFKHVEHGMVASLEQETDVIELQLSGAAVMTMTIFKVIAFLLAMTLLALLIGMIKKNFRQLFLSQKRELTIMSLLGESSQALAAYQSTQVVIFSIMPFLLGMFLAHWIFFSSIIKTLNLTIASENVQSFNVNHGFVLGVIFLMLSYLFITVYKTFSKESYFY